MLFPVNWRAQLPFDLRPLATPTWKYLKQSYAFKVKIFFLPGLKNGLPGWDGWNDFVQGRGGLSAVFIEAVSQVNFTKKLFQMKNTWDFWMTGQQLRMMYFRVARTTVILPCFEKKMEMLLERLERHFKPDAVTNFKWQFCLSNIHFSILCKQVSLETFFTFLWRMLCDVFYNSVCFVKLQCVNCIQSRKDKAVLRSSFFWVVLAQKRQAFDVSNSLIQLSDYRQCQVNQNVCGVLRCYVHGWLGQQTVKSLNALHCLSQPRPCSRGSPKRRN